MKSLSALEIAGIIRQLLNKCKRAVALVPNPTAKRYKASYGLEFEKTTTAFSSQTFGSAVNASDDDAIVYSIQDIDVWEYPTYTDNSGVSQGSIIVLFPRQDANHNGGLTKIYPGTLPTSPYAPNHEPHNVLSYSMQPPNNISVTIRSDQSVAWGNLDWEEWVQWENVKNNEDKRESKVGVGTESQLGNKLTPFQLVAKEDYNYTSITTNKTSFSQDVKIHVYGLGIDNKYSYDVTPYFYWSKGGTLMLDYVVSTDPNVQWWKATYNQPDPAFNLPWKDGNQGDQYKLMTREITFDPPSPKAGQSVTITAKIRNYSPWAAKNVKVDFYNGNPGSNKIGQTHTIAQIDPMGSYVVTQLFSTSGYANKTLNIYGQIEPYPNEIHPDNNLAYAPLPVRSGAARVSPATLSVADNDLVFGPEVLGWRLIPMYIAATVRAQGDTFTHVSLDFWDGDPKNGGTLIGGRSIPMVVPDQPVTESILWTPTGPPGQRDIWVTVWYPGQEDDYSDNRAHKALPLWRVIRWPPD